MIIHPKDWRVNYESFARPLGGIKFKESYFVEMLKSALVKMDARHLAYSGGLDSTILLHLLTDIHGEAFTYTISSREDHPDLSFARLGSEFYNSSPIEFIVNPTHKESDEFIGDNAVRQFFEEAGLYTNEMICGDGIDEFMCGYYDHTDLSYDTYEYYLTRLLPDHLIPLNNASMYVNVSLPYLNSEIVSMLSDVYYRDKVDIKTRKKLMVSTAKYLGIPNEIIERNKYGFCDAFREKDK